jgi:iron complex outermembrane receptor protein
MHSFLRATALCLTSAVCLSWGASSVYADGADEVTPADVDEIIVTTTRSNSNRQTHIGNIASVNTRDLVSIFPTDLVNKAPGVLVHRGNGQEHLTSIRSPVLTGGAGAGSFLFMEDGLSFRAAPFANVNSLMDSMSFDTARVEIIRGPGSALYGSNAVHGLVNFITKDATEDSQNIRLGYGSYGRYELSGSKAWSGERSSSRLALSLTGEDDAYRDASGFQQRKLRLQHNWQTAQADYRLTFAAMSLNQETAGYAEGRDAYRVETLAKQNSDADEAFRDAWSARLSLDITIPLDSGATLKLRPYLRSNDMRFGMHFLPGDPVEENDHSSIGLQSSYTVQSGDWNIIAGLDSEYTRGKLTEFQSKPTVFGYEPGLHYDYAVDATVIAPYLHTEQRISDATRLTVGVRAEFTQYDYDNKTTDGNFGNGTKYYRPADRSDDYVDISPKFGLSHDLSPDTTVFLNIAHGNRAPQTTDAYRLRVGQRVGDIKSESLMSYEAGLRGRLSALRYEVSAYMMEKRNYYFRDSANNNVWNGRTQHVGIELDADLQLSETVALAGAASYAEHEWDFNHRPAGTPRAENIITAGDAIDSAPKTLANFDLNWQVSDSSRVSLAWEHVGRYYLDAANIHSYDGHNLAHLKGQIALDPATKLLFKINNLFDRHFAKRADYNTTTRNYRYFPGEPRHISITLTRDF